MASSKTVAKRAMKSPEAPMSFGMSVPKHQDPYEIQDAARTIEKHHEIKSDKKLHSAAKKHLRKKHKAIGKALAEG